MKGANGCADDRLEIVLRASMRGPVEWRTVPRFPHYMVSSDGQVYAKPRKLANGNNWCGGFRTLSVGWKRRLWMRADSARTMGAGHADYPKVTLADPTGRIVSVPVHQLVLEAFVGARPEGMQCRHLDGNQFNNRVENLCWGTPAENAADRQRHEAERRERFAGLRTALANGR